MLGPPCTPTAIRATLARQAAAAAARMSRAPGASGARGARRGAGRRASPAVLAARDRGRRSGRGRDERDGAGRGILDRPFRRLASPEEPHHAGGHGGRDDGIRDEERDAGALQAHRGREQERQPDQQDEESHVHG